MESVKIKGNKRNLGKVLKWKCEIGKLMPSQGHCLLISLINEDVVIKRDGNLVIIEPLRGYGYYFVIESLVINRNSSLILPRDKKNSLT